MSLAVEESFSGMGFMRCYGDMSITMRIDGEGFLDCKPAWGSPAAPPQGIVADGDDGSHWVTVDDKGSGDCDRMMSVDDGHQTRLFCGYAECTGYMNIQCTML